MGLSINDSWLGGVLPKLSQTVLFFSPSPFGSRILDLSAAVCGMDISQCQI